MKELPPDIHEKVQALRASGDALQETGEFVDAVVKYEQAFALLPEPKAEWNGFPNRLLLSKGDDRCAS